MEALFDPFTGPLRFFAIPLANVLFGVYTGINAIGLPYAMGFSIIGLTILIRIVFYPLTNKQLRASKKMQDIAPKINDLKNKYKGDRKRIQEETMKLYKENDVNPAAGCLPTLIQLPVLFGLYGVVNTLLRKTPDEAIAAVNSILIPPFHVDEMWATTFFGIPIGESPQQMLASGMIFIAIAIPVVTGFFQFIQSKMMFATPPSSSNDKKNGQQDFATTFQKQAAYIFPLMIGFFAFTFPFGLALYWNTFSIFGIIQQYKVTGLGGLEPTWQKIQNRQKRK